MAKTLAERMQKLEQQKARLAEQEAKLKTAERKARTRKLIEGGGLLEKCRLIDLPSNALFGALRSLMDSATDPAQVEKWAVIGGRAFQREADAKAATKDAPDQRLAAE